VRLSAPGKAFRRISDGSTGVDRCEIAGIALVWALARISERSPVADPSEIQLIALHRRSGCTNGTFVQTYE
jgi:hypothetical protein